MAKPIRAARAPDGALTYALPLAPADLPAVTPRALLNAWETARDAAHGTSRRTALARPDPIWPDASRGRWAPPRTLIFEPEQGEPIRIEVADRDAAAWAEAIDSAYDLESLHGMALCLRLLALVETLARLPWLAPMFRISASGIDLHPALLGAAATLPLDAGARFDEGGLRRVLSRPLPATPTRALPDAPPTA